MERVVGLALVLVSLTLWYSLTLPALQGPWYVTGAVGIGAACGTLCGMPLLVTGRIRQKR
jgi:hypothetical protein